MNCFSLFTHLIINDRIGEAKALATHENINDNDRIIAILCSNLSNDNSDIIQYFVNLGASVDSNADKYYRTHCTNLSYAAINGFVRITRKLLDLGHPVNAKNMNDQTALEQLNDEKKHSSVAMVLIDAGCCAGVRIHKTWEALRTKRLSVRSSAISTMGAMRTKYGKDVTRIIGRCIWSLRGIYE